MLGGLINMGGSPKISETIPEVVDFRDAQVGQTNPQSTPTYPESPPSFDRK